MSLSKGWQNAMSDGVRYESDKLPLKVSDEKFSLFFSNIYAASIESTCSFDAGISTLRLSNLKLFLLAESLKDIFLNLRPECSSKDSLFTLTSKESLLSLSSIICPLMCFRLMLFNEKVLVFIFSDMHLYLIEPCLITIELICKSIELLLFLFLFERESNTN